MTAPARQTKPRWSRWVFAAFSEGPDKPPTIGSMYSVYQPSFAGEVSKLARRKDVPAPNLPSNCKILDEDRVLQFTRYSEGGDNDLNPTEITAAREWLKWRWLPGWKPRPEDV